MNLRILFFFSVSLFINIQFCRHESGLYTCTATNGVGYPASQTYNVTVQCKSNFSYF